MATIEEARTCSRCSQPGDLGGTREVSTDHGIVRIVTATCRNQVCPWYDTGWPIQINSDGSVPDPAPPGQARGEKQYGDPITGSSNRPKRSEFDDMIARANRVAGQWSGIGGKEV